MGAAVYVGAGVADEPPARAAAGSAATVPLKDAKLNIEHNATDRDTGFQGFVDGEGWRRLDVRGPKGPVAAVPSPRHVREAGADRAVLRVR